MSWFIAAVIIKIGSGIKTERSVEQNEEYGNPHIHKQLFLTKMQRQFNEETLSICKERMNFDLCFTISCTN